MKTVYEAFISLLEDIGVLSQYPAETCINITPIIAIILIISMYTSLFSLLLQDICNILS